MLHLILTHVSIPSLSGCRGATTNDLAPFQRVNRPLETEIKAKMHGNNGVIMDFATIRLSISGVIWAHHTRMPVLFERRLPRFTLCIDLSPFSDYKDIF